MNSSSNVLTTLLMVAFLSSFISTCSAFVTPRNVSYRSKSMPAFYYQSTLAHSELSMASSIMESPRQSFEDRMRGMVLGGRNKKKAASVKTKQQLPPNIKVVRNLDEYKTVVGGERERIVVVRFFAPWCKACKAIRPLFYRLAHENANVLFVEVPVTEANANLHQGLGIPSLPFGHIYSPNGGLVEELKITRPHFSKFAQKLQSYVRGQCDMEPDDVSSPYEPNELPATSRTS